MGYTERDIHGVNTHGLGHTRSEIHTEWDTQEVGYTRSGTHREWDTHGVGYTRYLLVLDLSPMLNSIRNQVFLLNTDITWTAKEFEDY